MNLQITAIFSGSDRASDSSVTYYQLFNMENFAFATLAKPQVVSMMENGTTITVLGVNGEQVPCAINSKNLVDGSTEKWIQAKDGEAWTSDIVALPQLQDINGAIRVSRLIRRV